MKKYFYLFAATGIIIALIIMSGSMINNTVTVETFTLTEKDMDNTVSAAGKLQYSSGKAVKLKTAALINQVYVKNGDTVTEGDALFSYYKIDDAYVTLAQQYAGAEGIESLLGSVSSSGGYDIIEEISKYCELIEMNSEYNGTVTGLSFAEEEFAQKNSTVLKISDKKLPEIPVDINESYIKLIETGQKADITFNALPDKKFTGTVTKISDEASRTGGLTGKETTVEVTLTLDETDDELRVGYSAACTIITSTDRSVLVIPYEAVRTDEKGDYVFVLKNGRAVKKYIKTSDEYKEGIRISSGLKKGDVILKNPDNVYDGQRVVRK